MSNPSLSFAEREHFSARAPRRECADWSHVGVRESQVATAGAGGPPHAADEAEHRCLMATLAKLSNEHRRVIGLRQFELLRAALVAQRTGRSASAAHPFQRPALEFFRGLARWLERLR